MACVRIGVICFCFLTLDGIKFSFFTNYSIPWYKKQDYRLFGFHVLISAFSVFINFVFG